MSDAVIGVLAGVFIVLPAAIALLAHVANAHSRGNMPVWQAAIFVVLFVAAVAGFVGIGVAGDSNFHGFSANYIPWGSAVIGISGLFLILGLLDID